MKDLPKERFKWKLQNIEPNFIITSQSLRIVTIKFKIRIFRVFFNVRSLDEKFVQFVILSWYVKFLKRAGVWRIR